MTYNAANMGSSLHKIATFKGITEWDHQVNFLYQTETLLSKRAKGKGFHFFGGCSGLEFEGVEV